MLFCYLCRARLGSPDLGGLFQLRHEIARCGSVCSDLDTPSEPGLATALEQAFRHPIAAVLLIFLTRSVMTVPKGWAQGSGNNQTVGQRAGKILSAVFAILAFASLSCISYGQEPKPSEYQIKAAYLYNFSRFVVWPERTVMSDARFEICVWGTDPFGVILDDTLAGESVQGRRLIARRISKSQEAVTCRILFVSVSEGDRLKEILGAVDKTNVLTVSDIPRFLQRGGMIQFVLEKGKVRFEVNLTNATQGGLTLSSDLLKVAVAVRRNSQPGD